MFVCLILILELFPQNTSCNCREKDFRHEEKSILQVGYCLEESPQIQRTLFTSLGCSSWAFQTASHDKITK